LRGCGEWNIDGYLIADRIDLPDRIELLQIRWARWVDRISIPSRGHLAAEFNGSDQQY
jgi:hypothetical protein